MNFHVELCFFNVSVISMMYMLNKFVLKGLPCYWSIVILIASECFSSKAIHEMIFHQYLMKWWGNTLTGFARHFSFQSFSKKWSHIMESYVSEKSTKQVYRYIQAKSSRIQKLGKRYNGLTNQQNLLSHKWFKNTTDLDHKLWTCFYG